MQTRYFHLTDFKRRENGFQGNPHLKHSCGACMVRLILFGEGKMRKEFAEWHVAWRAEWHNYAKYDLRGE